MGGLGLTAGVGRRLTESTGRLVVNSTASALSCRRASRTPPGTGMVRGWALDTPKTACGCHRAGQSYFGMLAMLHEPVDETLSGAQKLMRCARKAHCSMYIFDTTA